MQTLFWISVIGVTFSYFIYPLTLLLCRRRITVRNPGAPLPMVSIIVTAHNEAGRIETKMIQP